MRGRAARMLAIAAAGALSVFGFAPAAWYPLTFIGVGALYACGRRRCSRNAPSSPDVPDAPNSTRTWRQAACYGLAWGLGFFLTGVSWVYISLTHFGGVPAPLAVLATLMFCLYLALFPALTLAIHAHFPTRSAIGDTAVFAACWTLAEWLRGELLSGFPWLALGYAHGPPSPLAGWAPVFGVWGVGFAAAGLLGAGLPAAGFTAGAVASGATLAFLAAGFVAAGACFLLAGAFAAVFFAAGLEAFAIAGFLAAGFAGALAATTFFFVAPAAALLAAGFALPGAGRLARSFADAFGLALATFLPPVNSP